MGCFVWLFFFFNPAIFWRTAWFHAKTAGHKKRSARISRRAAPIVSLLRQLGRSHQCVSLPDNAALLPPLLLRARSGAASAAALSYSLRADWLPALQGCAQKKKGREGKRGRRAILEGSDGASPARAQSLLLTGKSPAGGQARPAILFGLGGGGWGVHVMGRGIPPQNEKRDTHDGWSREI